MNWISDRAAEIRALEGQIVSSIVATEWPLRFNDEDEPLQYEHPDLPFLQLWGLYLKLLSGKTVNFKNYQSGAACPILLTEEMNPWEPDLSGENLDCCRTRELAGYGNWLASIPALSHRNILRIG